jgi:beta-1,4-mannosyl-glycoprotein beta-1,4-N-acetylglucosaminyltransferase
MKLFDCTLYYDEDLILEARLNILSKYFDKFIICEAKYTHSGEKKKLNFDINKFSEFKNKIVYLTLDNEPKNIIYDSSRSDNFEDPKNWRSNAVKRIAHQRNSLLKAVDQLADSNDFIFYSDNDEIPNMINFDKFKETAKIILFEQKLFYYKFNLLCDRIFWYGTRAIKKKNLIDFEWIRQIKPKKYPFFRIDTLWKNNKYINLKIIRDGGWHFTRIITPEEIHKKELIAEHHDEYKASKKDVNSIKDLIERRVIDHDHLADKTDSKYGKEFKLKLYNLENLPHYIKNNINKYQNYLDLDR